LYDIKWFELVMGNVWAKTTRPDASDDAMITNGEQYSIPLPDEHDFPMAFEDKYRGNATSHELLDDGSRRAAGRNREKKCSTCSEWIDLGNVESGEMVLTNHEGKRRCLAKVKSNKQELELHMTEAALEDIQQSGTVSPRTPHHPKPFTYSLSSPLTPLSSFSTSSPYQYAFNVLITV
jgi:hypothetical protein